MKRVTAIIAYLLLWGPELSAHPGNALVTDPLNNIYFAYWGGTFRLSPVGNLDRVHSNDFHFLSIDLVGRFADVRLPDVLKIVSGSGTPSLFAFPEHPAVFHTDGNLYLAPWSPGRIRLDRLRPDGQKSTFVDKAINP